MKTFTLDEANALLPVLESLLRTAMAAQQRLQELQAEAQELAHRVMLAGGTLIKISDRLARKLEVEKVTQRLRDILAEVNAMGVQVKDIQTGLLDFPCQMQDEIVLLCWKLGEPAIGYWHTLEAGFRGRQPVDDRIPRGKPIN